MTWSGLTCRPPGVPLVMRHRPRSPPSYPRLSLPAPKGFLRVMPARHWPAGEDDGSALPGRPGGRFVLLTSRQIAAVARPPSDAPVGACRRVSRARRAWLVRSGSGCRRGLPLVRIVRGTRSEPGGCGRIGRACGSTRFPLRCAGEGCSSRRAGPRAGLLSANAGQDHGPAVAFVTVSGCLFVYVSCRYTAMCRRAG